MPINGKENQESHDFVNNHIDDNLNGKDLLNGSNQMPIVNAKYLNKRTYPIIDNNENEDNITIIDVLNKHKVDTISNQLTVNTVSNTNATTMKIV